MRTTAVPPLAIGSSILGLVTAGMYDNPLAIYREYIQNAVDALARSRKTTQGKIGKIEITLDPQERTARIQDNGPGLSYRQCLKELLPIGRSNKCIGTDRGFRGIGRLSGLAFASTVTFRTRRRSCDHVTRVTWTGIGSATRAEWLTRAEDALQHCVAVETEPGGTYPSHFFEAEVSGISRHAVGSLLNEDAVRSYISEVCPVPMSPFFPFTRNVEDLFGRDRPLTAQVVTVNDITEPVHRQHEASIRFSDSRTDHFEEFEEFRITCLEGAGDAAIAWVAHSSYMGAIPKAASVRGIRARLGNIQIGDEAVFNHLFHEDRFNRWCVGEVHILDPHIIPNGRRDYFEPGPHLRNLENHLGPFFRRLSSRCRTSSASRNKEKKLLESLSLLEDVHALATAGYLPPDAATELVKDALQRESVVREKMVLAGTLPTHLKRLDQAKKRLRNFTVPVTATVYVGMTPLETEVYQRVFQELVKTLPSLQSAKQLIETVLSGESKVAQAKPVTRQHSFMRQS